MLISSPKAKSRPNTTLRMGRDAYRELPDEAHVRISCGGPIGWRLPWATQKIGLVCLTGFQPPNSPPSLRVHSNRQVWDTCWSYNVTVAVSLQSLDLEKKTSQQVVRFSRQSGLSTNPCCIPTALLLLVMEEDSGVLVLCVYHWNIPVRGVCCFTVSGSTGSDCMHHLHTPFAVPSRSFNRGSPRRESRSGFLGVSTPCWSGGPKRKLSEGPMILDRILSVGWGTWITMNKDFKDKSCFCSDKVTIVYNNNFVWTSWIYFFCRCPSSSRITSAKKVKR